MSISPHARARLESARRSSGQFGNQAHSAPEPINEGDTAPDGVDEVLSLLVRRGVVDKTTAAGFTTGDREELRTRIAPLFDDLHSRYGPIDYDLEEPGQVVLTSEGTFQKSSDAWRGVDGKLYPAPFGDKPRRGDETDWAIERPKPPVEWFDDRGEVKKEFTSRVNVRDREMARMEPWKLRRILEQPRAEWFDEDGVLKPRYQRQHDFALNAVNHRAGGFGLKG